MTNAPQRIAEVMDAMKSDVCPFCRRPLKQDGTIQTFVCGTRTVAGMVNPGVECNEHAREEIPADAPF